MTRREIGLGIQSDKRPGEYAVIATAAETFGIDVLSVYGDLMFQPPIGALLEMAAVTGRVRLGPACLNPFSLHPHEIAGQIAYLDMVSHGRAYLGLARGTWLEAFGIDQSRPLTHLAEAVALVRRLLSRDDRGFDGAVFQMAPGTRLAYEPLRAEVPLLIGTWGPQTLRLAGRIADEVKIGGSANPAIVPYARRHLDTSGRDVDVVVGAVSVVDEDGDAARRLARTEVAMYLAAVAELDPTAEVDPDLVAFVRERVAANDSASAGAAIPGDVLDLFAFAGTPESVAAQVSSLFEAGAQRVELGTPHGLSARRGVEQIGAKVLAMVDRG